MKIKTLAATFAALACVSALPATSHAQSGPELAAAPLVVGHRGASGTRPEETIASYDHAVELGVDYDSGNFCFASISPALYLRDGKTIDPATAAGLVTREVRTGSRDGATTRIAVARRTYPTDQADLWDAVTNASRIPRWFTGISGDLVLGGRYQLVGNAGGVVERCEEPESFAVTWEMGPMVSWLSVTLAAVDGGTVLELVHEAPVDPDLWTQYGPGAVGVGWDLGLLGLGMYLAGDARAQRPGRGRRVPHLV